MKICLGKGTLTFCLLVVSERWRHACFEPSLQTCHFHLWNAFIRHMCILLSPLDLHLFPQAHRLHVFKLASFNGVGVFCAGRVVHLTSLFKASLGGMMPKRCVSFKQLVYGPAS